MSIYSVQLDPSRSSTIYAAGYGYDTAMSQISGVLYTSTDSGVTWTKTSTLTSFIVDLTIHPTTPTVIYAITQNGALYMSQDSGKTWNVNSTQSLKAYDMAIDKANPKEIYLAGSDYNPNISNPSSAAVYTSTDGGITWARTYLSPVLSTPPPVQF